jgi:hypothetical protein
MIVHICAHRAATPLHQGRQRRRAMKRTHIELVLKEMEVKSAPVKKAAAKKAEAKPEVKTPAPAKKPEVEKTITEDKK